MRIFVIFFLSFSVFFRGSIAQACAANDPVCGCNRTMLNETQFADRVNYLWTDHPELFTPVPMRKYDGGWSIVKNAPAPVYLTELTFKKIKKNVNLPFLSIQGHAYRYYYGDDLSTKLLERGSGRDQLIQFGNLNLPLSQRLIARKGSGVNAEYSEVNGEFERFDFRKNGFQSLPITLTEQITAEQFKHVGVPTVAPTDFIIPPAGLQFTLYQDQSVIDPQSIRVETERNLAGGRASHHQSELSETQKIKIVAPYLLWNLNHGALNPENISGHGEVLDTGHTSFSVPMVSGQYRCTTCKGSSGSRMDGRLVSAVDYFFTPKNKKLQSLSNELTGLQVTAINHEILWELSPAIRNFSEYTGAEIEMIRKLYREEYPAFETADRNANYSVLQNNYHVIDFYRTVDQEFYGLGKAGSENYVSSMALSTRFVLQLTALKIIEGDAWFAENVEPFFKILPAKTQQALPRLLEIYGRDLTSVNQNQLRQTLFQEYRPANVLAAEIKIDLFHLTDFSLVAPKTQAAYQRLRAPLVFTPEEWWSKLAKVWWTLEKPEFHF
jgi:hypothetical protein